MAKKGKGFLGAVGSFFGSIPAVKSVKKAAKSVKKKLKKAKKKLKKAIKKAKKKLKKKIGKVFTKARKLKNKLSKSKLVKKIKRAAKKVVLAGKKVVKKAKKYAKAVVKKAKQYAKTAPAKAKNAAKKAVVAAKPVKTGEVKTEQVKKYASPNKVYTDKDAEAEIERIIEEGRNRDKELLKFVYNFFFEDIETMISPDSTWGERAEAALFTFVKPAKLADKARDGTKIIEESKNIVPGDKNTLDDFDLEKATNKQKGNYGEIKSSDNLVNNKSLKDAGYDLKPIGRGAPSSVDDKIVKGIDGIYENKNTDSKIKYVIDEAKFGSSQLSQKPKDGPQMSDDWLKGTKTKNDRILKAVEGDEKLAKKIKEALDDGEVERVLSKVDSSGNVKTYRINAKGEEIGEWP
ncbi:hypothetical protein [Lysinibacillus sphaericus]|uniref:hypothetical protein n=1 Tax=Lysinibacillus sphaericus TaxID=1421 RepID=UPI001CBD94E0|nr:hypothetical protein [Lysinibacillus sphaericus]